ncbi:hypothetical protein C8D76_103165 [Pasteurella langaaensis DSM 22999]|uniref:Uncharacterized protein n=1 Tax=Alitibacter langaaensis DSM 22999 TaxID=1122935 RepID=A0A2U0TAE2_9PAST|nr:hypothetical protein C8D76_103165 [Pasteurella langaaensis DSM 22999]
MEQPVLLSKAKVVEITSLSQTTIWRMMKRVHSRKALGLLWGV